MHNRANGWIMDSVHCAYEKIYEKSVIALKKLRKQKEKKPNVTLKYYSVK